MDIFKIFKEYDIEYDPALNRLIISKPICVSDFVILKNIAKSKNIKEIIVERKVSRYERKIG